MQRDRFLVTWGSGFLGGHVGERSVTPDRSWAKRLPMSAASASWQAERTAQRITSTKSTTPMSPVPMSDWKIGLRRETSVVGA